MFCSRDKSSHERQLESNMLSREIDREPRAMRHPRQNLCEESQGAHEGSTPSAFMRRGKDKVTQMARRKEAARLYHAESRCSQVPTNRIGMKKWSKRKQLNRLLNEGQGGESSSSEPRDCQRALKPGNPITRCTGYM